MASGPNVAYFSMEIALEPGIPTYSGGLGVLSGDHTKEASDLGLPFVGMGFIYPQGYFRQVITPNGDQEAIYTKVRFAEVPASPAFDIEGKEIVVSVALPARNLVFSTSDPPAVPASADPPRIAVSRTRTRSRSSFAALSVKVMPARFSSPMPDSTRATMRAANGSRR